MQWIHGGPFMSYNDWSWRVKPWDALAPGREALMDTVLTRPDVDESRTALLGASFGGYMTNWVAGHTDRFGAIVTHAGLWALDQQHATTDAAWFKTSVFGRLEDPTEWY